jgi:hypothetical protein
MFPTEIQLSVIVFHENGGIYSKLLFIINEANVETFLCEYDACSVDGCYLNELKVVATIKTSVETTRSHVGAGKVKFYIGNRVPEENW